VAKAEDEILVTVVRVVLHQVPEDGSRAYVDQRLGKVGVVAKSHPHTPAKQDNLHRDSFGERDVVEGMNVP
jgi:hypothetical protein